MLGIAQTRLPEDWQPPARFQNRWSVAGQIYRTATAAWEAGITPGGIVRTLGPWGSGLIQQYVRNRCKLLDNCMCRFRR